MHITQDSLLKLILEFDREMDATITIENTVKMNKKDVQTKSIMNPYEGAKKRQIVKVILNPKYQETVNEKLAEEGKKPEFEAAERVWGTKIGNGIVQHGDKFYVAYIEKEVVSVKYFFEGSEIEKDLLKPFMPVKKITENHQGLETPVKYRTVTAGNITNVKLFE